jgi:hypothetical protein
MLDALFWSGPSACAVVTIETGRLFTPIVVALALGRGLAEAGLLRRRPAALCPVG